MMKLEDKPNGLHCETSPGLHHHNRKHHPLGKAAIRNRADRGYREYAARSICRFPRPQRLPRFLRTTRSKSTSFKTSIADPPVAESISRDGAHEPKTPGSRRARGLLAFGAQSYVVFCRVIHNAMHPPDRVWLPDGPDKGWPESRWLKQQK